MGGEEVGGKEESEEDETIGREVEWGELELERGRGEEDVEELVVEIPFEKKMENPEPPLLPSPSSSNNSTSGSSLPSSLSSSLSRNS